MWLAIGDGRDPYAYLHAPIPGFVPHAGLDLDGGLRYQATIVLGAAPVVDAINNQYTGGMVYGLPVQGMFNALQGQIVSAGFNPAMPQMFNNGMNFDHGIIAANLRGYY